MRIVVEKHGDQMWKNTNSLGHTVIYGHKAAGGAVLGSGTTFLRVSTSTWTGIHQSALPLEGILGEYGALYDDVAGDSSGSWIGLKPNTIMVTWVTKNS